MPRTALLAIVLLALSSCTAAAEVSLDTDEDKIIYALGFSIAHNFDEWEFTPQEVEALRAGLADGLTDKDSRVDINEWAARVQEFGDKRLTAKRSAAAEGFLSEARKEPGAVETESGLIITQVEKGSGASPTPQDTVKVHYHGTLPDGTVFDSSVERDRPATFPLNRVIPCWTEGLQLMQVGGRAKLVCPAKIAYGQRGFPPKIKPGATLVFDVQLLEITK